MKDNVIDLKEYRLGRTITEVAQTIEPCQKMIETAMALCEKSGDEELNLYGSQILASVMEILFPAEEGVMSG